ncbi:MAG: hypothetical protein ACRDRT_18455, partial [Pseudonocardiaceae bacterium]
MEFIASLVRSLAWPTAVVIVVVVFRKQVALLLSDRLQHFKAGPIEMEFVERMAVIQADIHIPLGNDQIPLPEGPSAELLGIAHISPAAAVLQGHTLVENRLRALLGD